jgi:hypothetical protein
MFAHTSMLMASTGIEEAAPTQLLTMQHATVACCMQPLQLVVAVLQALLGQDGIQLHSTSARVATLS